jgi:PPM family protein phosphatase
MHCPACNVEAAAGSKFCEECGSALEAVAATASGTADPKLRCTTCGAGPNAIDDDGFCTQCGDRRLLPWRHRFEDVLSAKVAGVSDIGTTYHENQDFFVLGLAKSGELVAIVCDGVSHSQHPMEGSKVSCDTALASICADLKGGADEPNAILKQAMSRAQEAICQVPFVKGLKEMVGGRKNWCRRHKPPLSVCSSKASASPSVGSVIAVPTGWVPMALASSPPTIPGSTMSSAPAP